MEEEVKEVKEGLPAPPCKKKKKKITSERQYHPEGIDGVKKTHPK